MKALPPLLFVLLSWLATRAPSASANVNAGVQISGVHNLTNATFAHVAREFSGLHLLSLALREIISNVAVLFSGSASSSYATTQPANPVVVPGTPSPNNTNSTGGSDGGLPWYSIVSIVFGTLLGVGLMAWLVWYLVTHPNAIGYHRLVPSGEPAPAPAGPTPPPPPPKSIPVAIMRAM